MITVINHLLSRRNFILKAEGLSMFPILRSDDIVHYKKIQFKQVKIDNIILVRKNKRLFTHRIIYKTKQYLITKGDNNLESDGKIVPQNVLAKVVSMKRNGQNINIEQIYLFQSTLYFQEIVKIKTEFEKAGINFLFLKGLPLHLYFEKGHPRRIYADCDVLVDKKDFEKAEKILFRFGYKKSEAKNKQVENNYFKNVNGFPVVFDLHLEPAFLMTQFSGLEALYPQKLIDKLTAAILQTKRKVRIQDTNFYFLSINFQIVYLALHFFHHNFRGAFRLDFMNTMIQKSKLSDKDWLKMVQITNQYKLGSFVYPAFKLLQKYYRSTIPNEFFKKIQPVNPLTRKLVNKIIKQTNIFDDEPRLHAGVNRFVLIFLLSPQSLWRKLFIFFNLTVVWSIFWVIWRKLSSFFSGRLAVH